LFTVLITLSALPLVFGVLTLVNLCSILFSRQSLAKACVCGFPLYSVPLSVYHTSIQYTIYYRAISHASLAISREYSFTTLGVKEIGEIGEEIPSEGIPYEEEIPAEEVVLAPPKEGEIEKSEEFVSEGVAPTEKGILTIPPEKRN